MTAYPPHANDVCDYEIVIGASFDEHRRPSVFSSVSLSSADDSDEPRDAARDRV